jgi:hypothetical protein
MPDPEVRERPQRRTFTAAYKLRIVEEANAATEPGAVGALLRREGPYSSHLVEWRTQLAEEGADVFSQQLRLLERGEVPTPWHLGPAPDVVTALGELPGRMFKIPGKDCNPARNGDRYPRARVGIVPRVPIRPEGRADCFGSPVDRDVRQKVVLAERPLDIPLAPWAKVCGRVA